MANEPTTLVTPQEFARRTGLTGRFVRGLLRRGVLFGARKTASGRWRIPASAVELYLRGERPRVLDGALTPTEFLRRVWLEHEGRPFPGGER